MKKIPVIVSILIPMVFMATRSQGQLSDQSTLEQVMKQDSADVNTLAAYPENTRDNVFEVASHPEGVTKLNDMQKKSNEQFKNLLSTYSKDEQEKIWNITRYDGLISNLATGGRKSNSEIENILKDYPQEAHDDALQYATNHPELLEGIDRMNKEFSLSFDEIVKSYPEKTQTAFREIIKTPEVVTILNSNMNMTVRLGDVYKSNPGLVKQRFDSLNLQLAQQKAKDLEDWKETMKNDPDAKNELKQSAEQYAKENGYSESDYASTNPVIVEHYVYRPYPYWCGYPWWHADPYWYPYPLWYQSGFYFWHNDFVWVGQPSWYFIHWHFNNHPHFYHYPHLTNAYLHYYYGPRRAMIRNSREVTSWVRTNRSDLPRGFLKNDPQRPDRIKEFGKFEMNYDEQIKANPRQVIKRNDFLQQHSNEYPHMQPSTKEPVRTREAIPAISPGRNDNKYETPRQQIQPPVKVPESRPREPRQMQPPMRNPEPRIQQQPRAPKEIRQNPSTAPRQNPRIEPKQRKEAQRSIGEKREEGEKSGKRVVK